MLRPKLIETTNRVLGIKNYIGASIFDIQLDFDKRSISYFVGYRSCTNLNYAFTALAISVEINQDHIQISELVYEPILESQEITDIELREIEDFIQHLIECTHSKELQPFVNVSVHLFLMGSHPFAPKSDLYETIRIELTFKVDSADHIPSIERMGAIVKNVQYIIKEKVLKQ